jgi:hypothetical protein
MCEGWSLEIGVAFRGSVVRRDRSGERARWIASINSSALGEFLELEIAMHRVEELIEASMMLVLHDWELCRAAKAKR